MSFELNGCVRVARAGFLGLILCLFVAGNLFAQTNITVTITKINGLTTHQAVTVTATITNDSQNSGVTWSATGGAFSNTTLTSTLYTAPSTPGTYSLTATSVTDPTKSMSTSFGVTDLAGVFTYHNDLMRDGVNASEYELTPKIFLSTPFGKLFSCTVDGAIYAQPLWMANLAISGPTDVHNVVFVATQHDSLYAFDADVNATPCTPLWHVSLIDTAHGGSALETTVPAGTTGFFVGNGAGDITPEVGVTGTPVIDPSSNTLYVVSKSVIPSSSPATSTFYQRLHAIDITTGNERVAPHLLDSAISYPGTAFGAVNGLV